MREANASPIKVYSRTHDVSTLCVLCQESRNKNSIQFDKIRSVKTHQMINNFVNIRVNRVWTLKSIRWNGDI